MDVLGEDGSSLSVSLRLKVVPTLLKYEAQSSRIGDDTVMHNRKLALGIRPYWVAITGGGRTVSRPASMRNRDLRYEGFGSINGRLGDLFAQACDLADLLEEDNLAWLIAVNAYARRVIATILLSCQTVAEDLANCFAILKFGSSAYAKRTTLNQERVIEDAEQSRWEIG